ncbi:PDF1B [Symbiodinium sp. KB8]|nr:PDF1B [Symbiodinium sp. KB8]
MESGRFIGKVKPDKDVERLARKFRLDDPVASRLTELTHRRKKENEIDRMHKDLNTIEQHLKYCKRANAMATLLVGKLLEGEVEELPDLSDAEKVMEKYRLDDDAKSKLREIIEKRAEDKDEVLVKIKKHLDNCANPSSMICKIARPLIDNENLPDPPDRPQKGGEKGEGKGGGKGKDKDNRDRNRSRSRDRHRSRSRRRRSRSRGKRSRSRGREKSRSQERKKPSED